MNFRVTYTEASSSEISGDRLRLGNPYAHVDGSGGFSALSNRSYVKNVQKKKRYSIDDIELRARNLQKSIWQHRKQIWPDAIPSNPIEILDPVGALNFIGYDCDLEETLGQSRSNGKLIEIAGTIDMRSRQVHISRQFTRDICSFTAAHELGHAMLHETVALHRDRPLDGASISRDAIEFEADKFATFFLMPQKLVKKAFKSVFLTDRFSLDEATAFALGLGDYESLGNNCKTLRQLSKMLASSEHYNGRQFVSLANQFRVSVEAMAIRIEELELLEI